MCDQRQTASSSGGRHDSGQPSMLGTFQSLMITSDSDVCCSSCALVCLGHAGLKTWMIGYRHALHRDDSRARLDAVCYLLHEMVSSLCTITYYIATCLSFDQISN